MSVLEKYSTVHAGKLKKMKTLRTSSVRKLMFLLPKSGTLSVLKASLLMDQSLIFTLDI